MRQQFDIFINISFQILSLYMFGYLINMEFNLVIPYSLKPKLEELWKGFFILKKWKA